MKFIYSFSYTILNFSKGLIFKKMSTQIIKHKLQNIHWLYKNPQLLNGQNSRVKTGYASTQCGPNQVFFCKSIRVFYHLYANICPFYIPLSILTSPPLELRELVAHMLFIEMSCSSFLLQFQPRKLFQETYSRSILTQANSDQLFPIFGWGR